MRGVLVSLWVLAVVGLPAGALAHVKYEGGYVWENGNGKCLWDHAELSHGNGGGYAQSIARAVFETSTTLGDIECWEDWNRPAYYLGARNLLFKWRNGGWNVCVNGTWRYNEHRTDEKTKTSVYRTPCRRGTYANFGGGITNFDGAWRGGHMYSGSHTLPAD